MATTESTPLGEPEAARPPGVGPGGVAPEVYDRRWFILGVLCLSLVLVVVGNSSLNVALPPLQKGTAPTSTQPQWLLTPYPTVFPGVPLPAGAPHARSRATSARRP